MNPETTADTDKSLHEDFAVVLTVPDGLVVHASNQATLRLRVDPGALPTSLSMSLVESDWDFFVTTIVPKLLTGSNWSGVLQFRDPEGVERQLAAIFVPHVHPNGTVDSATLLLDAQTSSAQWAGAVDHLTGLPTRPVLLDRLEQALGRVERRSTELAVLFLDLDGLKLINDRYGHETGDELLVDTAQRLKSCLRLGDTVSRFGGDEFVILCEDLEQRELAHQVCDRILDSLLRTDGKPVIGASIGIAFARASDLNAGDLVARADAAMYRAKSRGGRRAEVFDEAMQRRQDDDMALRRRLLSAIEADELAVAAQPIFELRSGIVRGVELFVRFAGDSLEPIGATEVLRLAREQTEAIDTAVISHALSLAHIWQRTLGIRAPRTHVNISPQTLSSPDFAQRLAAMSQRIGVRTSALMIEVDEMTILHADNRHIATLQALGSAGFGVVIDGLANGQLPLKLIHEVRPDLVKIDAYNGADDDGPVSVQAAAARRLTPLGVPVGVKRLETQHNVRVAVASGVWTGQGQVLHPVSEVAIVNDSLFVNNRLGF